MGNLPLQRRMSNFDFENNQHPLLINTVILEILKYSSIPDLKNLRLVCKSWDFEALRLLKKIEWIQFENIDRLNSFVKFFETCPQNIINRSLDCGQILVPGDLEPGILFQKILPIRTCIRGLKVNINIQQKRTFVAHEAFQHLAQNLQTFDVRFIKNYNISLTPPSVYPPTQLPSLPALTSVKIRMDPSVNYGNRVVHPEYVRRERTRPKGSVIFDSEYKMLIEFIQELVAKSPLLSEIHLILSNYIINNSFQGNVGDSFQNKSIQILTNLKINELEKITHLRFTIDDEEDIAHLLNLTRSGLNKLKYINIDFMFLVSGMDHQRREQNLLEILECQKDTLEYFKLKKCTENCRERFRVQLPPFLPKLKVLKVALDFDFDLGMLDLNTRFPKLIEIDISGPGCVSQITHHRVHIGPLTPCHHVKTLHWDRKCFPQSNTYMKILRDYFPNATQAKYHMRDQESFDERYVRWELWRMTSVEDFVLKVPLYSSCKMIWAVLKPFHFICGEMNDQYPDSPEYHLTLLNRLPNMTWLRRLKSLRIKQRRRYGCPEVRTRDEIRRSRKIQEDQSCEMAERLVYVILSNMPNLKHFSSDVHCFSKKSIAELKMKIPDFEPGRSVDESQLFW